MQFLLLKKNESYIYSGLCSIIKYIPDRRKILTGVSNSQDIQFAMYDVWKNFPQTSSSWYISSIFLLHYPHTTGGHLPLLSQQRRNMQAWKERARKHTEQYLLISLTLQRKLIARDCTAPIIYWECFIVSKPFSFWGRFYFCNGFLMSAKLWKNNDSPVNPGNKLPNFPPSFENRTIR